MWPDFGLETKIRHFFHINSSHLLLLYVLLCWIPWLAGPLTGLKPSPQQPPAPHNPVLALLSEVKARRISKYQTTPIQTLLRFTATEGNSIFYSEQSKLRVTSIAGALELIYIMCLTPRLYGKS